MFDDPYALPDSLQQFALIPRIDEQVDALSDLAAIEDWEYLRNIRNRYSGIILNILTKG